jgi:hypothetical protein
MLAALGPNENATTCKNALNDCSEAVTRILPEIIDSFAFSEAWSWP